MNLRTVRRGASALALMLVPGLALAQGVPLFQSGTVTPNHLLKSAGNGMQMDAGGLTGDANGRGVSPFGITDNLGLGLCSNSAVTGGQHYEFCLGHKSSGEALLSVTANGGALAKGLIVSVDGTEYPFPSGGAGTGDVVGPGSIALTNSLAVYNGTTGKLLKDGKNAAVMHSWDWPASFASLVNAMEINVGSYPANTEIPASVLQGLSVKVAVPASYTQQPWPPTAISGYITNANANNANAAAVALFGFAGVSGDSGGTPGTVTALNVVASNCAKLVCADGSGFNGAIAGLEVNLDYKKKGAAQPAIGAVHGVRINGGAEVDAISGSYALHIDGLNLFTTPKLPWLYGIFSENGAATTGMFLGRTTNAAVDGTSQAIAMRSRSGGADKDVTLIYGTDQYLEITGLPDLGGIRALNVWARNSVILDNVVAVTLGGDCMNFANGTDAAALLCNTVPENVYRNTTHVFQTLAGAANLAKFQATSGAGTTGLLLTVNNAAGVNLASVTLGAADSGGAGFKVLRVPN